ncbi:MAG: ImuA family protein [Alphaproteobacteria bacterium]
MISIDALRNQIAAIEGGPRLPADSTPDGEGPVAAHFPPGGLHALAGDGAWSLAAALLSGFGGPALWCQREGESLALHPDGLRALGADPAGLTLVRCPTHAALLRTVEEGLRCAALAAVVADVAGPLDLTASRRLHLAARGGGVAGLLILPERTARSTLSLATAWTVVPAGSGATLAWELTLIRSRDGRGGCWRVERDGQTNRLDMVAPVRDGPADAGAGDRLAG